MKVKLDKNTLPEINFLIELDESEDVSLIDNYLIIDTESTAQTDFYSPLATDLYRAYFMNDTEIKPTNDYYGNELYHHIHINNDSIVVNETLIDIHYTPPSRSEIVWEDVKALLPYTQLPVICFDIETIDIEPNDIEGTVNGGRIILIGVKTPDDEIILNSSDEKQMLIEFIDLLEYFGNYYDEWVLSGHNVFNFDLQVIYYACKKHNVSINMWAADYPFTATYTQMNGSPMHYLQSKLYYGKCSIIDTLLLAGAEEKRTNSLSSFSLKDLALTILNKEERRLELDYLEIKDLYNQGNLEPIKEYLLYDLRDQKILTDYFLPPVYYLQSFINYDLQKIHYTGIGSLWSKLLKDWYKKFVNINLIEPEPKYSYQGALTGINPGLYHSVSKLDISSLYPSIMLRYGLAPLADYDGIFLKILKYMLEKRLSIKNSKELELQYFQLALKIFINGGYGFTGTGMLKFNCMRTAALTTAIGRIILRKIFDTLSNLGVTVLEVDTDGLIIDTSWDDIEDIQKSVQNSLPSGINIGIDWRDYSAYIPKAKNYILYKPNGDIKTYGIYKKRNRSRLEKEFIIEYIRLYLQSAIQAEDYYKSVCFKLLMENDIDFVKVRQRIPKNSKWLLSLGKPGQIIEFYVAEQKRYHKKTSKPIKSERLPISTNDNSHPIWSEYYLSQLKDIKNNIDNVISQTNQNQINLSYTYTESDNPIIINEYDDIDDSPF